MLNDPSVKVAPDWYCVAIDETWGWSLAEEDKPFIEKMLGIYVYDANLYTYCCESTPSHFLHYLGDAAVLKGDVPEDVRERINERYEISYQGDSHYRHVSDVKAIAAKHRYGNVDGWEDLDDRGEEIVHEYYRGNPVF